MLLDEANQISLESGVALSLVTNIRFPIFDYVWLSARLQIDQSLRNEGFVPWLEDSVVRLKVFQKGSEFLSPVYCDLARDLPLMQFYCPFY